MVNFSLTHENIGLVVAGERPHLAWLDPHDLDKDAIVCPLPELMGSGIIVSAHISPNRQQWALLGGNGAISLVSHSSPTSSFASFIKHP